MEIEQQIIQYFNHFHAHPEVSWKEVETTRKLAEIMTGLGVKHHTFPDVTGLIAEIGEIEGRENRMLYLFQFKTGFVAFRPRKACLGLGIWVYW